VATEPAGRFWLRLLAGYCLVVSLLAFAVGVLFALVLLSGANSWTRDPMLHAAWPLILVSPPVFFASRALWAWVARRQR